MSGVLRIEIQESADYLKSVLDSQRTVSNRSKVQVLWWIKTGAVASVNQLAAISGYHRTTISRWLSQYRRSGLGALLEIHPKTGRVPRIRGEVRSRLEARLNDPNGFGSYKEVHQWLQEDCGVEVAYKTVHKLVHYRLKAKLKHPRPQLEKQALGVVEILQKTPVLSSLNN